MHIEKGIRTKLIEVNETDARDIIYLRNNPANNKFLFQRPISIENQVEWINNNRLKNDNVNFKVVDLNDNFKGTVSIYDIKEKRGEFGRYIITDPFNAIEAEYLILKFGFGNLKLNSIYCQTNVENAKVWKQHSKFGFHLLEIKDVLVGSAPQITVKAVIQEITAANFYSFDYSDILRLFERKRKNN